MRILPHSHNNNNKPDIVDVIIVRKNMSKLYALPKTRPYALSQSDYKFCAVVEIQDAPNHCKKSKRLNHAKFSIALSCTRF